MSRGRSRVDRSPARTEVKVEWAKLAGGQVDAILAAREGLTGRARVQGCLTREEARGQLDAAASFWEAGRIS